MAEALQLVPQPGLASRVTAIQRDGFVYFLGVISPAEVAELRSVMDRLEEIPEYFDVARESWSRSFNNAFNRDEILIQYLDKPEIIELAEKIHGADCHIIALTAWITGPGRPEQTLHVDYLPVSLPADILEDPRVNIPAFITTAHFYLSDMYEELGPTKFVPGSHLSGREPNGDAESGASSATRVMWLSFEARCGTADLPTPAIKNGICFKCITLCDGLLRSSLRI